MKASMFSYDESSSCQQMLCFLLSNFNGLHSFSISCRKEPLKVSLSNISSCVIKTIPLPHSPLLPHSPPLPPHLLLSEWGTNRAVVPWVALLYLQIEMNHSVSTMTGKTKLKVIFLGNQSVGKTCIIDKYINDRFEQTANPTVGIDFLAKNVTHNAKNYRLQLWDTAGQERFRSLIPGYLKDAHCALIVFDVTAKASFADIEGWIKLYSEHRAGEGFIFLVGNKIDREFREVTQEEGLEKANRLGLPYFEISAKSGAHVDDLFVAIIEQQTDKKVANSSFLPPARQSMKPVEVVREEKEEKEEEEGKSNIEDTGAKISEEQTAPENIVLKNEKKPQTKPKKADCC